MSANLTKIKSLLPSTAVLIPLPLGRKKPITDGWQNTTLDDTLSADHQEKLSRSNIGVVVGRPSRGLCSIDIDDNEAVQPFLDLNPRLTDSLRTKGARGCNIWVQIIGHHPKAHPLKNKGGEKFGEWRADGNQTVIAGRHPDGHDYSIVVSNPPVQIRFDDIAWPDDLILGHPRQAKTQSFDFQRNLTKKS